MGSETFPSLRVQLPQKEVFRASILGIQNGFWVDSFYLGTSGYGLGSHVISTPAHESLGHGNPEKVILERI